MNGPAGMGMNPATGGPVGAPQLGQQQQPPQAGQNFEGATTFADLELRFNTYLYDHFLINKQYECARVFKRFHRVKTVSDPNGTKAPDQSIKENAKQPDDLEAVEQPLHSGEHSFLMDWFCMFWDTYRAARSQAPYRQLAMDYMQQQRMRSQNDQLKMRMMTAPGAMNMNGMNGMKQVPGGRPNPQMQAELQRRMQLGQAGQGPDQGGPRPQTPGSMDNAPSPSKKPRLDNGAEFGQGGRPMGNPMMANGMDPQMAAFAAQNGQAKMEGMNGIPGQLGGRITDDIDLMQRQAGNPGAAGQVDGRHALQDYQLQLMLLEQQNKKRLLQARREQDTVSTNLQGPPGAGGPAGMINNGAFAPNMSPQGSRGGGPSPGPSDQIKRGTPKLAQTGLPGSPMGDMQRNSPGAPGFDPSNGQLPAGMPANYYQQQMRQPQTSHPNFQQMPMPGMSAQQLDQMNRMNNINNGRMMNGQQVPPGAQGAPFNAQQAAAAAAAAGAAVQQRPGNMAPPPAPTDGPGSQPAQSSPAQPPAPPTPSQTNKAAPKKKETAAQKKKNAPKKGATTAATPTESADAPASTPATPMTPSVRDTFPKSGAPSTTAPPLAPPMPAAPVLDNGGGMFDMSDGSNNFDVNLDFAAVGSADVLDNFDFDSFLTNDEAGIPGFDPISFDNNEIGTGNV